MCIFHDWEVIDSKNTVDIESDANTIFTGNKIPVVCERYCSTYYKKGCLKCGKIKDDISWRINKEIGVLKNRANRKKLVLEMIK